MASKSNIAPLAGDSCWRLWHASKGAADMYIFKDRYGRYWITVEGLLRYFGVRVYDKRKYFYNYEIYTRWYK